MPNNFITGIVFLITSFLCILYIYYKRKQKLSHVKTTILIKSIFAALISFILGIYLIFEGI